MSNHHPDAIVNDGVIRDILSGEELPSYSGLCLAILAGRVAVMFTTLSTTGRNWDIVQWGSTLSMVEITKYIKENKNETI